MALPKPQPIKAKALPDLKKDREKVLDIYNVSEDPRRTASAGIVGNKDWMLLSNRLTALPGARTKFRTHNLNE